MNNDYSVLHKYVQLCVCACTLEVDQSDKLKAVWRHSQKMFTN